MEEKNLALLGFVSKAADYLKDNLSDDSLEIKELKEVDLDKIKSELSNKIDNSFHARNSNEDLINAGKEAFDSFISKNTNMIDEFKDIFDGGQKEENNDEDDNVINHLMKILKDPDQKASEEDEYVNIISNAINTKEDDIPKTIEVYKDVKQDEEIDNIFSEILANENIIDDFVGSNTDIEEAKDDEEHISMSSNEFKQILEDVLGDVYKEINRSNDQIIEKFKDIEKELENQKSIFENKTNDKEDDNKYEPLSLSQALRNVKNDNSSEDKDVVEDYFKNLNESFNDEKEDDADLDPFVTVDDINDLEEDTKEDEVVEDKQEEVAELDKEEKSPFVSLFDKDYLDDYDKRSLEEKYIINPCADKLEQQEKAKALEEENLRKEEEKALEENISTELENIFSDLLNEDEAVEEAKDNNEEEALLEEEYEPLLNQDYIDDYNNRSLDEIYIANPCLDYLEQQDSLKEEGAEIVEEEVDVDRLKEEAIEQLEKELFASEQLDVLEKEDEEIKIEEVNDEIDSEALTKEYIDDYNNRSLEDIYIANPGALVKEEPEEKEEEVPEISNEVTDDFLNIGEEFKTAEKEDENLNQEYIDDYNNRSIDDIYIANPGAEEKKEVVEETNEELVEEEPKQDDAVSELLNDYDQNVAADIEDKLSEQEELKKEIYNSIKSIYPYLSNGFIKGVYDLKDSLSNDYKDKEEIIILHRLVFKDVVGLRKFVDIIMSHDYLVNVDEKQMIVDTFKEHVNSDGKILTDIFEVANQAKLLTGEYEGYRIIEKDA